MSKEIISDELLRKAVARAIEIESSMYERKFALEKEHSFSGKYAEQMKGLLAELDETKECAETKIADYSVKKMSTRVKILLIAAIVMLLGTLTVTAEPVREFIYQLKETIFPDNTEVSFEELTKKFEEKGRGITSQKFEVHELKNVPEKYTLEYEEAIPEMCFYFAEYVDVDNQTIRYQQHAVEHIDTWSITSDGTKAENIAVNGNRGYLLTDEDGYHFILYPYEGYVYSISGYNDVDELVALLELVFEE